MKQRRNGFVICLKLLNLLGKLKYIIILAVFGGYLGNSCAIAVMTFGTMAVMKSLSADAVPIPMFTLLFATLFAGILRGLLRFLEQYNNHYIAFKLLASLRDKIFGSLRILAPAKLDGKQKGDIISMLTSDVETLEVFYAHTISPIMIALLVDGTTAILAAVIHPYFGLTALLSYLIIGIAIPFLSSALLKKDGVMYRNEFAGTSSYFLDSVKGIQEIIMYGAEAGREEALRNSSESMNKKTVSIKTKSARCSAFTNLFVSLTVITTLIIGIRLVNADVISYSRMMIGLVMISSSFGPVLSLASLPQNLTQTLAAGDRILDFMEEKPVVSENKDGQSFEFASLTIDHVNFAYDSKPVLSDVTMELNPGEILGLVGESGCGKSTLLKLMLRFYDCGEGSISYNQIPLPEIQTESLHKNVVMVSQDTYLFDDTIRNNLLIANQDADMEEIISACKKASIHDFISGLPSGYDTEAGLMGEAFSAGERQRIGLARAFLSHAPVVLLDEVTSNVDAINEGIILKAISDAKDTAFVIVSHRESTMQICTKVYHVNPAGRLS